MPKATVTLSIDVTLDVPAEFAAKVSQNDLIEMARAAIPDSGTTPNPLPNGVQVTLDGVGQEDEKKQPVFADVYHVEHDTFNEPDIEFCDEGFKEADPSE